MARNALRAKEPIRLRAKSLKNGGKSLYLDCYEDGKRTYDFLKLYLIPERNADDKRRNADTMRIAETVKAKRVLSVQEGAHGIEGKARARIGLVEYLKRIEGDYRAKGKGGSADMFLSVRRALEKWEHGNARLTDINRKWLLAFVEYLSTYITQYGTRIGKTSAHNYFSTVTIALNRAERDGIIKANPVRLLDVSERPKSEESKREYLTLDEVRRLAATDCGREDVKRAFLFSCFCGLRVSDIRRLKWTDIRGNGKGGMSVEIRMKKTGEPISLPLSENATEWMPKAGGGDGFVFPLPFVPCIDKFVRRWAAAAGITKKVTFHVARHTFATLALTYGADLYTVSKLLGHTDVKTTQIYAKIVDGKKEEAVRLIPKL